MSDEISRADVIRKIRNLVAEKGTGTLYIRTNQNRVVMVAVQDGNIITLSSGPRHGENAIPMLREMSSAVVRVDNTAVAYHSDQMPPTAALLAMLDADVGPGTSGQATVQGQSVRLGPEAAKVRGVLGRLLTDHMGPVGPMVCDQVLGPLGNSMDSDRLRAAIEMLATEIGDSEEARTFSEKAWKELHL
jgi:hypothetical protein